MLTKELDLINRKAKIIFPSRKPFEILDESWQMDAASLYSDLSLYYTGSSHTQ